MPDYPMTIFHDGACPICRFDVANLQARNDEGRLQFIDIAAADFDAARHGLTQQEFAAQIRARLADGSMIAGIEVFRRAYRAVGLGWIVAPTAWGPLQAPADALYRRFARHRHSISRRFGNLFVALAAWQAARRAGRCRAGACGFADRDAGDGR